MSIDAVVARVSELEQMLRFQGPGAAQASSASFAAQLQSATTPTTVYQARSESRKPSLNLLPVGFCPGQDRRAIASLMIATGGAFGRGSWPLQRPWSSSWVR